MKYFLVTLGCQMNIADSERVERVLQENGYSPAETEEEAEVLGILSCSVRQKPIDKVYSKAHKWNKWKKKRDVVTFVSGCILPKDKDPFLKIFDLVFPMSELHTLPELIRSYGVVTRAGLRAIPLNDHIHQFWAIKPKYQSPFEAFVPIQNGCDKFCTYCAVPFTRGREVSRPSDDILEQVQDLINHDYKSITLLGQNVNSYGNDKNGDEISFAQLLQKIGEMGLKSGKKFWVYFTSPHPRDMGPDVLEVIRDYPHLAKQIHLPLQSGDEQVLVKMNRKHSMDRYRAIVQDIRRLLPEATLFTDIIVGFSGETEAQFANTVAAMEEFRFNMAYIAQYSPRPGAASYNWQDDVPPEVKKERFHALTQNLKANSRAYNQALVGRELDVLVTGQNKKHGHLSALTEGRINVRFPSDDASLIGKIVPVKITEAVDFAVNAQLVTKKQPA